MESSWLFGLLSCCRVSGLILSRLVLVCLLSRVAGLVGALMIEGARLLLFSVVCRVEVLRGDAAMGWPKVRDVLGGRALMSLLPCWRSESASFSNH